MGQGEKDTEMEGHLKLYYDWKATELIFQGILNYACF